MKTIILFIVFYISVFSSFAQNNKEFEIKFALANEAYKAENYFEALPMYVSLYREDTTNANINYLVAYCHLKARNRKASAVPYLERAQLSISPDYKQGSANERNAPILTYKLLGDAYHIHSQFDKAIQCRIISGKCCFISKKILKI